MESLVSDICLSELCEGCAFSRAADPTQSSRVTQPAAAVLMCRADTDGLVTGQLRSVTLFPLTFTPKAIVSRACCLTMETISILAACCRASCRGLLRCTDNCSLYCAEQRKAMVMVKGLKLRRPQVCRGVGKGGRVLRAMCSDRRRLARLAGAPALRLCVPSTSINYTISLVTKSRGARRKINKLRKYGESRCDSDAAPLPVS
ncbi:hypothetical protein JZ751_005162 [Albula glossodonta]|uniref:Uncharacterized protein n=1 Tax=Albula glossodonta TaxID=121402 RepID=A0A8T2PD72_9TELE|nr:hypothetical protein JZ751_005162 [Albula glossodonta]